eukprot:5798928-Prymnesium_polylepis.1
MACSTEDLKTTPTFPIIRAVCTGRICRSIHPSSRDARQYAVEVGKPVPARLADPPTHDNWCPCSATVSGGRLVDGLELD